MSFRFINGLFQKGNKLNRWIVKCFMESVKSFKCRVNRFTESETRYIGSKQGVSKTENENKVHWI